MVTKSKLSMLNWSFVVKEIKNYLTEDGVVSIGLKSNYKEDFYLIVNEVLKEILPKSIFIENENGDIIIEELSVKFKRSYKGYYIKGFDLKTELVYFEESKITLVINGIGNGLNNTREVLDYLYSLFKGNLGALVEKDLVGSPDLIVNPEKIYPFVLTKLKSLLKDFKLILILDKDTYRDITRYSILFNGLDIIFLVNDIDYKQEKTTIPFGCKDEKKDLVYTRLIDLSFMFCGYFMENFIKERIKTILDIGEVSLDDVSNKKLNLIVDYLKAKGSYYMVLSYLEDLKIKIDALKLSNNISIYDMLSFISDSYGIKDNYQVSGF